MRAGPDRSFGRAAAGAERAGPGSRARTPDSRGSRRAVARALANPVRSARDLWRRLRAWRRMSFTAGGLAFTLGTMAVGFAALNTGNNLLYLLMGSMLGFITVSGWLSEQAIRDLRIERRHPRAVTVGHDLRIAYEVVNDKTRMPTLAVEISEKGLPERAFLGHVAPGGSATTRSVNSFVQRGVYPLGTVTLSTGFPFGMFRKERDLEIPGEVIVWPRTDRPVRDSSAGAGRTPRSGVNARGTAGARGDYRSLRGYRAGDDPKDIHWKSSARLREPVIREYERDGADTLWICLDIRGEPNPAAEVAIEVAASLAARAVAQQRPFGLVAGADVIGAGVGPGQLERVLDLLANVDFAPDAPAPAPPVDPSACILVGIDARPGFGDVIAVGRDADPTPTADVHEVIGAAERAVGRTTAPAGRGEDGAAA